MSSARAYAAPVARLLLALIFIMAGLAKLGSVDATQGYMALKGVPTVLFWPAVASEVAGGILVLIGYQTRIAALGLALFSALAGLLFHIPGSGMEPLAAQNEINHLLKNFAIAGGLLLLVVHGAGAFSVDERN